MFLFKAFNKFFDKFSFEKQMSSNRTIVDTNGRHFSANSFDRFGDDLCELILSYLRLEDKIRLQCVAKQWNRLMPFDRQRVLVVDKDIDDINNVKQLLSSDGLKLKVEINRLKSLLKKCPNIRRIRFNATNIDESVMNAITDFCPRLESVSQLIKLGVIGRYLGSMGGMGGMGIIGRPLDHRHRSNITCGQKLYSFSRKELLYDQNGRLCLLCELIV